MMAPAPPECNYTNGMQRSYEPEIMDGADLPVDLVERVHRGLSLTHTVLGNHAVILRAIANDPQPVSRVLDIGCGHGGLLEKIRRLPTCPEVIGVDLQPPTRRPADNAFPILKLDAVRDPLPPADIAVSVCLVHHLREEELIELIRNVGRSCRRFVILDLVRHPVPLALFSIAAPLMLLSRVNVLDGRQSIRRAYTPREMRALTARALEDFEGATFRHKVAPFWIRQTVDIRYPSSARPA